MVSIIIVNYNSKGFIVSCINSISKYAPRDTEVIVVDNSSTDGSVDLLKSVKSITLIRNKYNLGYAKAINIGIKSANGDYIFILNPDTKLYEGVIDNLKSFAQKNNKVGIVAPKLLNRDGSLQDSCYHEPGIINAFKEYFLGVRSAFRKYAPRGQEPVAVDAVVGAAMFIPRKIIDEVGMFNDKYFMYFEDLDFCRKVRENGFEIFYLPSAVIYHEHGGVTKTVGVVANSWLADSSKKYHGILKYHMLTLVLLLGQKWRNLIKLF